MKVRRGGGKVWKVRKVDKEGGREGGMVRRREGGRVGGKGRREGGIDSKRKP